MISRDELRRIMHYDPETGAFRWKVAASGRSAAVGDEAGHLHKVDGYRQITINREPYRAHRLAWLYVHGEWPADQIDHINRIRSDNRISNLREATRTENNRNGPKRSSNTVGLKGVSRYKNGFRARITAGSKELHLGVFDDPEHAAAAYRIAAAALHGEFARTQ